MENNLTTAVNRILDYLRKIPLSRSTVRYYGCCYNAITAYCQSNEITAFSSQDAKKFFDYQQSRYQNGEIAQIYCLIMRKAAIVLAEYLESRTIQWKRRNYHQHYLCTSYEKALKDFVSSLENDLSPGSIRLLSQAIRQFLTFLENRTCYEFSNIKMEDVKVFIIQSAPSHKGNMVNLTWPVKKFFSFLNDRHYSELNVNRLLSNPVPTRKKVLPCFSQDELNTLFSAVDTSTVLGKRDYAIMKLALGTGLRAIDILNLRMTDINWRRNEISIVQQKTGTCITLPLLADVGNAIVDYILHARPSSGQPYIFLRERRPYDKLGRGAAGANIIRRYQSKVNPDRKAGDGKTFHAFRRTAGTRLIEANVPLTTTAQILGHRNLDTSKRYIFLNDEMLQICCMDMSKYATVKEGLR
jgi:site-specific recombinase XerD